MDTQSGWDGRRHGRRNLREARAAGAPGAFPSLLNVNQDCKRVTVYHCQLGHVYEFWYVLFIRGNASDSLCKGVVDFEHLTFPAVMRIDVRKMIAVLRHY